MSGNIVHTSDATFESDAVMIGGKLVGISQWSAYSANAHGFLSLALMDLDHAEPGTEVTLLWGEPDSRRPSVDRHQVREIRATVEPATFVGWRWATGVSVPVRPTYGTMSSTTDSTCSGGYL